MYIWVSSSLSRSKARVHNNWVTRIKTPTTLKKKKNWSFASCHSRLQRESGRLWFVSRRVFSLSPLIYPLHVNFVVFHLWSAYIHSAMKYIYIRFMITRLVAQFFAVNLLYFLRPVRYCRVGNALISEMEVFLFFFLSLRLVCLFICVDRKLQGFFNGIEKYIFISKIKRLKYKNLTYSRWH